MLEPPNDQYFMREALRQAQKAREASEVPVGAVAVLSGKIIGRAHRPPCLLSGLQSFEMFDFDLAMALAQIPVRGVLPSDFRSTFRGAGAVFDAVNRFRDARAGV